MNKPEVTVARKNCILYRTVLYTIRSDSIIVFMITAGKNVQFSDETRLGHELLLECYKL